MNIRIYYLTEETILLIQDALEQAEFTHNDRSTKPGDDEDELATSYSRIQRILLHQRAKHELVAGSEEPCVNSPGQCTATTHIGG